VRERRLRWRKNNPEKEKVSVRRWQINNPEKVKVKAHRRRARKRNLSDSLTAQDWNACLEYWQRRCAYCSNPEGLLKHTKLHADHYLPLASPECPGTTPANILPACAACNHSKQDTDPATWLERKFGRRKAAEILDRIRAYFDSVKS
jgi:5-methylcytosine-specific restriction endonuclease McrA